MDNIRPLKTDADYNWAVAEVERYFVAAPAPGTAEADRFDLLCDLIDGYDTKHFPIPEADPIAIIAAYMDDHGLKKKDLAEVIGHKSKASEVMNKSRPLSLAMIQAISAQWHISAELLVKPYHLAACEEKQKHQPDAA